MVTPSAQPTLPFEVAQQRSTERFDGETFVSARDGKRLTRQLDRVREWAVGRDWFTVEDMRQALGYPVSSYAALTARLRDLRKQRFGGYVVEGKCRNGLWKFRVGA